MKFILSVALLLSGFVFDAFSQSKKSPVRLSLATEQTEFRPRESAKVKLTFENKTGKTISSVHYLSVSVILERISTQDGNCHWNDCYIAFFSPTSKTELPNRGLFETEVDLADLHWVDAIDSNSRITSQEKNFFTKIKSGDFRLKVELHHSLDLWAENDPRFKRIIESNKILIAIKTEKQ